MPQKHMIKQVFACVRCVYATIVAAVHFRTESRAQMKLVPYGVQYASERRIFCLRVICMLASLVKGGGVARLDFSKYSPMVCGLWILTGFIPGWP